MTNSIMKYMQAKYPSSVPNLDHKAAEIHACILNIENEHIRENIEFLFDIAITDYLLISAAKTAITNLVGAAEVPKVLVDAMIFNDELVSSLFPQLFEEK